MQRTQTICLVLLSTIAVGFSLYFLKSVLLPFVIAVFIVIGCRPVVAFFEQRLRFPPMLAYTASFLIGVALLVGFAFLTWVSINDLSTHSGTFETRVSEIATWVLKRIPNTSELAPEGGEEPPEVTEATNLYDSATIKPEQAIKEFFSYFSSFVQQQVLALAGSLSSMLSYAVLILIFVFFLMLGDPSSIREPNRSSDEPVGIVAEVEDQIRKYLVMKTVISLVTGFIFGMTLWLFGVPLAIVFGFLAFLLNFIPNIGPLISTCLPVPFLLLNSEMSIVAALICFVLIGTIQFVSGNVIETRLMGQQFDVSPVVLLLGLMFFGLVWGIAGMFLATPLISLLKIVLQYSENTKPIAELLAGRWPTFQES
ncbi:MAG: AI-2E family transporter [bacterium]|nr:AI-2E family transporter [bacterium]